MIMKKLLGGLTIASILATGVGVGVALNTNSPLETKADSGATLYFDNSNIDNDTAKYWVHAWKESNENVKQDAWMTSADNGLFNVTLDSGAYDKIIFVRVSSDTTEFIWPDKGGWNQTSNQSIPTDGKNTFVFSSFSETIMNGDWETRSARANGTYLVGKYHGLDENWDAVTLSNDKVAESVTYDENENKFYATVELYAGDYFKIVNVNKGIVYWETVGNIESADDDYYPVGWQGNNVKVIKSGIYYITIGFITEGAKTGQEWVYVDNSASTFAYEFLNSMTCDSTGKTEPAWKSTYSWSYFSTWYGDALDSYAQDTFYTATNDDEGTNIEKFVSRYFTMIANHGYSSFVTDSNGSSRGAVKADSLLVNEGRAITNPLLVSAVISSVALAATGGLFLFRRKRNQD